MDFKTKPLSELPKGKTFGKAKAYEDADVKAAIKLLAKPEAVSNGIVYTADTPKEAQAKARNAGGVLRANIKRIDPKVECSVTTDEIKSGDQITGYTFWIVPIVKS